MGQNPIIVAVALNVFLLRSLGPGACGDVPGECTREADAISSLQTETLVSRREDADITNLEFESSLKSNVDEGLDLKHGEHIEDVFRAYIKEFGRTYSAGSPEYVERLRLFAKRKSAVESQNSRADRLWTAGINAHSDRNDTELQRWLGRDGPRKNYAVTGSKYISLRQDGTGSQALATECTKWNDLAAVKDIQNQGSCGSCWALSAITVLRAHAEIAGRPRSFSAQELVNCVENPHHCGGTGGCRGATVELAMDYVMQNGVATREDSPYYAYPTGCLKPNPKQEKSMDELFRPKLHTAAMSDPSRSFGMVGWERLPENQYEPLLHAVSERGPVAVSVEGSNWFSYRAGIFDACASDPEINHAVLLVGYGEDAGKKYWLLQNAWGSHWGEEGKIRLLRTDSEGETCGTDWRPEVGSGCDGGPSSIKVCGTCGVLYNAVVPHFNKL